MTTVGSLGGVSRLSGYNERMNGGKFCLLDNNTDVYYESKKFSYTWINVIGTLQRQNQVVYQVVNTIINISIVVLKWGHQQFTEHKNNDGNMLKGWKKTIL